MVTEMLSYIQQRYDGPAYQPPVIR